MYHFVDNFQTPKGDALVGYYVKLKDSEGAYATLYSDTSLTPIINVSGLADAAKTDANGMYDLYVADGDYDVEFYDKNNSAQLVSRIPDVPMYGLQANADLDAAVTAAEAAQAAAEAAQAAVYGDLASTASGKGDALVGTVQGATGAVARTVQAKLREFLAVTDFGAVGDGVADDTAELQAAIDAAASLGARLYWPAGNYLVSDSLTVSATHHHFFGDGRGETIVVASTADPIFIVSGRYGRIQDIGFQGGPDTDTRTSPHAIVYQDAANGHLIRCSAYWFGSDGIHFDPVWGGAPDGNNNNIEVHGGDYVLNDGNGLGMTLHPDNNDISFLGVNSSSNEGNGILLKGEGHVVDGGNIFANILYGIQMSESSDTTTTTSARITNAWVEANFAGGVRGGGKSARCFYFQKNNAQSYSADTGSLDIYVRAPSSAILDLYGNGTQILQANASGGNIFTSAGNITATGNVDWWLSPQGTGSLVLNGNVNISATKTLSVGGTRVITARQTAVGDATVAAGATPTKAEFDAFVAKFNLLLDKLGASGHGLTADA